MKARRGRAITLALGTAVCGVLATAILSKDRLAEEWHIRRLESAYEEARNAAAGALAARKSDRAVPHLIQGLFEELSPREESALRIRSRFAAALLAIHSSDPEGEAPVEGAVVSRARAESARREGWLAIER